MVESVTLTPEEQRWLKPLFLKYDLEDSNIAMGERVRPLLEQSGLSPSQLSQIWQIVDVENRGFLDYDGFAKVMRLVYHAQRQLPLSPRLANIPAGMPDFSHTPARAAPATAPAAPMPAQRTSSAAEVPRLQALGTGGSTFSANGETRIPPLRTAEKQRFGALFDSVVSTDGFIAGATARDIFLKARLPQPVLGKIWALIDVEGRGKLTKNEFVVAMHLIQSLIENLMPNLPSALPSAWLPWLGTRGGAAKLNANLMASSATGSQTQSLTGALTGAGTGSVASPPPVTRNLSGAKLPTRREASLTIEPTEREQFDRIFDSLDTNKVGILGPGEAVPVLMKSGLSEDVLARVWDLADTKSRGQLDKRDFALAMHFVKAKLNGQELPSEVDPAQLGSPPPPAQQRSGSVSSAPPPAPPATQPRVPSRSATEGSSLTDLVSLDSAVYKPLEPVKPRRAATDIEDRRFVPTTSFGQQLLQQRQLTTHTEEAPNASPAATPVVASATGLGPTGAAVQNPVVPRAAVPNLADQQRSQSELEAQISANTAAHTQSNDELAAVLRAKAELETKLRDLKVTYDAGTKQVHETQQQIRTAREEIQQLEREIALRTSGLDAIKTQYEQEQQTLQELEQKRKSLADQNTASQTQHENLQSELATFAEQRQAHEQAVTELTASSENLQSQIALAKHEHEQRQAEGEQHRQQLEEARKNIDKLQAEANELKTAVEAAEKEAQEARRQAGEAEAVANEHERAIKAAHAALAEAHAKRAAAERETADARARAAIPLPTAGEKIVAGAETPAQGLNELTKDVPSEQTPNDHPRHTPPAPISGDSPSLSVEQARSLSMGSTAAAGLPADMSHSDGVFNPVFAPSVDPSVFRLPMQRPHSVSSSVVNNPPQSVQGDPGSEPSEQPTPDFPSLGGTEQIGSPLDLDSDNSFEFVDARNVGGALEDSSDDDEGPANAIPGPYSRSADRAELAVPSEHNYSSSGTSAAAPGHLFAKRDIDSGTAPPPMPGSLPAELESDANRIVQGSTNSIDELYAPSQTSSVVNVDENSIPVPSQSSGFDLTPPNPPAATSGLKLQPSFEYPSATPEMKSPFKDEFADFDDLEEAKEDEGDDSNPMHPVEAAKPVDAGPDEWQQLFMKLPARSTEPQPATKSNAAPESFELTELVNMGFSPEEASEALRKHQHNLSEATNYLLDNNR